MGCHSLGIRRLAAAKPTEGGDGERNADSVERVKAQTANISGREARNTPNPVSQMQSNGDADIESVSGQPSTGYLQDSGEQKQDRKDIRAKVNYVPSTVEDVEDEPDMDEVVANSRLIDAPWLLEPYDWLESDSVPRRVFHGCSCHYSPDGKCDLHPNEPPDQEDLDASGLSWSNLERAARATGHFLCENGGENGRHVENCSKEGYRVDSDSFRTSASRLGSLYFLRSQRNGI